MPSRHSVFWTALAVAETAIIMLVLCLDVFPLKREPIILGKAELPPPKDISTFTGYAFLFQESHEAKIAIDAFYRVGNYQKILGWVFIENEETKGQKVYVQLEKPDGTVVNYTTFPVERPDVGTYFKNALYNTAGFAALIPLADQIEVDACAFCLVVKNESGTYKSAPWKAGIRLSSRAGRIQAEVQSQKVKLAIDVDEDRRKGMYGHRYIEGWVYVKNQETRGQKVYVQLEKPDGTVVNYTTFPVERPDVGTYFKNTLYNTAGFVALIPLADQIDANACAFCLVVKNESGTYKSALLNDRNTLRSLYNGRENALGSNR